MSDLAYKYYNQLDTLDLSDLEILLDKINNLIFTKKESQNSEIESGLAFFNSIKGSVQREIKLEEELVSALDEKYANSNWYKYHSGSCSKQRTSLRKCLKYNQFLRKRRTHGIYFFTFTFWLVLYS